MWQFGNGPIKKISMFYVQHEDFVSKKAVVLGNVSCSVFVHFYWQDTVYF